FGSTMGAVYCLMEGVGSAESIDTVMKLGMNHPMGPLALADLIGLDTCLAIMNVLREGLGEKYRPCPLLERMVAGGKLRPVPLPGAQGGEGEPGKEVGPRVLRLLVSPALAETRQQIVELARE